MSSTISSQKKLKARPLIGRYVEAVPCELARVQSGRLVNLRDYESQVKLKRFSYDLKLHQDGKVMPAEGHHFIGQIQFSSFLFLFWFLVCF